MKSKLIVGALVIAALSVVAVGAPETWAQAAPSARHHVVFEVTAEDPSAWDGALNNIENMKKAFGGEGVDVEVVAHGKGLGMLVESRNGAIRDRAARIAQGGVVFSACRNSMAREKVTEAQLSRFAKSVDSGVAQVVRKEEVSWAHMKVGP